MEEIVLFEFLIFVITNIKKHYCERYYLKAVWMSTIDSVTFIYRSMRMTLRIMMNYVCIGTLLEDSLTCFQLLDNWKQQQTWWFDEQVAIFLYILAHHQKKLYNEN